jgi:hypothetical protein
MKIFTILAVMILIPFAAHAEQKVQGSGPNPYTECGIGAAIFKDVSWAAATSNVTWDLGSTALTSALSSPEMCNPKKVQTASLVIETLPELEKDLAMGDGEYVVALAETMGCSNQKDAVIADMRSSYSAAVSKVSYSDSQKADRAVNMYNAARNAAISAGCGVSL